MNKKIILAALAATTLLSACGERKASDPAAARQAEATRKAMDVADRKVGYPAIVNFAQKQLLKNAYEDMDQTTLTYVYTQAIDGRFVCLGQAIGYGISLGTQFTAPKAPQRIKMADAEGNSSFVEMMDQPEPNGLYMPSSGSATIVNLIDSRTGVARTSTMEPNIITTPNKLPDSAVSIPCPSDIDPAIVKDAKETSIIEQRK